MYRNESDVSSEPINKSIESSEQESSIIKLSSTQLAKQNHKATKNFTDSELREHVTSEFRSIAINARRLRGIVSKLPDSDLKKIRENMIKQIDKEIDERKETIKKRKEQDQKIEDHLASLATDGIDKERILEFLNS